MFTKITEADLKDKGVIGLPDTPGLSTADMQKKFEETARDVIIPAFNKLIEDLANAVGVSGASNVGVVLKDGSAGNLQQHVLDQNNPHGITAESIGAMDAADVQKAISEAVFNTGSADMTKAVYDTENRQLDVYKYTDDAIAAAITDALNGEV